jgi:hypothetical protein
MTPIEYIEYTAITAVALPVIAFSLAVSGRIVQKLIERWSNV